MILLESQRRKKKKEKKKICLNVGQNESLKMENEEGEKARPASLLFTSTTVAVSEKKKSMLSHYGIQVRIH